MIFEYSRSTSAWQGQPTKLVKKYVRIFCHGSWIVAGLLHKAWINWLCTWIITNVKTSESIAQGTMFSSLWGAKVYIHMSKWMAQRNLRRQNWHGRKYFTASWTCKESMIKTVNVHNIFEIPWRKRPRLLSQNLFQTFWNTGLEH